MPREILSYYLKHDDIRVKTSFQLALKCAPFLKGMKISCAIAMNREACRHLRNILSGTDISYYVLSDDNGRCLVLFYRRKELAAYLNMPHIKKYISRFGYVDMSLDEMLLRLSMRATSYSMKGIGFPHEIGIFFGYPVDDVKGFIENEGRDCLFVGYWKVYSDPENAKMIFNQYDQAQTCAVKEFLKGRSIKEIAQI